MNASFKRTGLVSAIVALASVAACSNKKPDADPSLKADLAAVGGMSGDLQLAPNSAKSRIVVSAIEGGPQAAPTRAAPTHIARPVQHKAPQIAAEKSLPVNAPSPSPVVTSEPAPTAQAEQPAIQAPSPAPMPAPRQDHRIYKTEAEVFRQMPWIRP